MPRGLVNRYAGIRLGDRFVVAATDEEGEDIDRALSYDASTLRLVDDAPAPRAMWAGRLGEDRLVAIARGRGDRHKLVVYTVSR
jgi:hypothetical protein